MYEMSNEMPGGEQSMGESYKIAVTQLFKTEAQQRIIDYATDEMYENSDRWYRTGEIADAVGKSRNAVSDVIQPKEGVIGPLIQFGIIEPKHNPMNMPNIPMYGVADTAVVDLLREWDADGGYDLGELFKFSGAQELVGFFLMEGPVQAWSVNQIRHEMGSSFEMVSRHIDTLVDSGLVVEVDDPRTTKYQLDTNSEIYQFLGELNNAVLDVAESQDP